MTREGHYRRRKWYRKSRAGGYLGTHKYKLKSKSAGKYLMKLQKLNQCSIFQGIRAVNPVDIDGAVQLSSSTTSPDTSGMLPLLVVPLLNIQNGGNTGYGLMRLRANGYDFQSLDTPIYLGAKGNIKTDPSTASSLSIKRALVNYFDVRLLLRQHGSKDVRFKVYLMKITHPDLNPVVTETNTDRQKMKQMLFYNHFLRQQIANPILENFEQTTNSIKGKYKIIWEKQYNLKEQPSILEDIQYKQVHIFKRLNQLTRYTESPDSNLDVGLGGDDPDEIVYEEQAENPIGIPDVRANYFLVITANASYSEADASGTANMDKIYLDIATKLKITIPAGDLIN